METLTQFEKLFLDDPWSFTTLRDEYFAARRLLQKIYDTCDIPEELKGEIKYQLIETE